MPPAGGKSPPSAGQPACRKGGKVKYRRRLLYRNRGDFTLLAMAHGGLQIFILSIPGDAAWAPQTPMAIMVEDFFAGSF